MTHVLVIASTFPASDSDTVPAFVKDQIKAMKQVDPSLCFSVLAPHDSRSHTKKFARHKSYDEYRFHYAWPASIEKLAGHGIMPALQANPVYYLLIPALFICEFFALYRLTLRLQPDLLYAHWFTPQAIIAASVGALTGKPLVFTTHASDVSVWRKIPVIGKSIVYWSAKRARAFTAVSSRSMEKLQSFFSEQEWDQLKQRSRIIPMGVTLPSNITSAKLDTQNILFIGRLAEKKGVQYLLPAFKNLLQDNPKATLTVAGDGPWLTRLKEQMMELKLTENQVTFPGYTTGSEKQQLIDSHSIYVVPSIITDDGDAEGLPVSLMEGLAAGKLCIATNESGADGILTDAKDGFLLPQKDTAKLTETLNHVINLSNSDKQSISTQAQKTAEQFSWPTVAKKHIDFLIKDQ